MITPESAYRRCEEITWAEARNFAYGIRLLPTPKRRAMAALYAMSRRIDDVGDGDWSEDRKLAALEDLHSMIGTLEAGGVSDPSDPVLVAVAHAAGHFPIPVGALHEIVEGCEQDVRGETYLTMDDTVRYCRLVAGSVGRLSLGVFGTKENRPPQPGAEAPRLADDLGVALQLTNMLRDLREDHQMGRIYLPEQERDHFGVVPGQWAPAESVGALIQHVAEQAVAWFERGLGLLGYLDHRSRACTAAMAGIYRRLLDRILAQPTRPLTERVSLPPLGEGAGGTAQRFRSSPVSDSPNQVLVVGGGLAGLAAAVEAVDRGANVTLLERRPRLGGATWSFQRRGIWFDNGQHVFLRCCTAYRTFLERIGAADRVFLQPRLDLPVLRPGGPSGAIRRTAGPAPVHLAPSLLTYPHLKLRQRLGVLRAGRALRRLDPDDPALDDLAFGDWLSEPRPRPGRRRDFLEPGGAAHGQCHGRPGIPQARRKSICDRIADRRRRGRHRLVQGAPGGPAWRRRPAGPGVRRCGGQDSGRRHRRAARLLRRPHRAGRRGDCDRRLGGGGGAP